MVYITLVLWERKFPRIVITMHQHGMSAKMARFLLKETNIYNHRCYFSPVVQTSCVQVVLLQWCFLTSLNLQDFFVPRETEMQKKVCKSWLMLLYQQSISRSELTIRHIQDALQRAPPFVVYCRKTDRQQTTRGKHEYFCFG